MKSILEMDAVEAKSFFMTQDAYVNFDLPEYFIFEDLLAKIDSQLNGRPLSDYYNECKNLRPYKLERVNHKILANKNGFYAWRPLQLIHPAIYVDLVNIITETENWDHIVSLFNNDSLSRIKCTGLPIKSTTQESNDAAIVSYWVKEVEERSIELSLEYDYIYHADIANCYGSMYSHAIPWALHTKSIAKNAKDDSNLLGNKIDKLLRAMSYGQTVGIPQGSRVMDFIAEIVLRYIDGELSKLLKEKNIPEKDYYIIRHRDDYRIFVNNSATAELILQSLSAVLSEIGMVINDQKTIKSSEVVWDAVKADKKYVQLNPGLFKLRTYREKLYFIYDVAGRHPNGGQLERLLQETYYTLEKEVKCKENIEVLISIVVAIAIKNPRTYQIASAIISKLIDFYDTEKLKIDMLSKIKFKFERIANSGHLEIWLQRISVTLHRNMEYEEILCQKLYEKDVSIWNTQWLSPDIQKLINSVNIVNDDKIKNLSPVIGSVEVELFKSNPST